MFASPNNIFFVLSMKKFPKNIYLRTYPCIFARNPHPQLLCYYYSSSSTTVEKSFSGQNLFKEKKMKFKISGRKSFFFKKKLHEFFNKPKKAIVLFGLKHSKSKHVPYIGKPQLNFQELNFTAESLFTLNRDLGLNPYFGNVSRGFSKLLVRISLKEYLNVFLRPRWYRLAKFQSFKWNVFRRKKKTDLFCDTMSFSFANNNNFYFFYKFFIKKRWFLLHILKK